MRVGVDEAGYDCDIAQVDCLGFAVVVADLANPFAVDRHLAVFDRRLIDGKQITGSETEHESTPIEVLRTLNRGFGRLARRFVFFLRQVNSVLLTDFFLQRLLGTFRGRQPRKVNEDHDRQ